MVDTLSRHELGIFDFGFIITILYFNSFEIKRKTQLSELGIEHCGSKIIQKVKLHVYFI